MPLTSKKRKSPVDPLPVSPMKILAQEPNAEGRKLVDAARLKFFHALSHGSSGSKADSPDDKVEVEEDDSKSELALKTEPTLLKRKRKAHTDKQTFIMKLFDRSVDLAPFDDTTSLYPICRAWMQNLPSQVTTGKWKKKLGPAEDMEVEVAPEINVEEILNALNSSEDVELSRLPPPIPLSDPNDRIPSPIHIKDSELDSIINKDQDRESLPTRDSLLQEHREKWVSIRKNWHDTERKNEDRYKDSRLILEAIYNKAQKHYQ